MHGSNRRHTAMDITQEILDGLNEEYKNIKK